MRGAGHRKREGGKRRRRRALEISGVGDEIGGIGDVTVGGRRTAGFNKRRRCLVACYWNGLAVAYATHGFEFYGMQLHT